MPFIIPSIFTAVDKFSPVVGRMGSSLTTFEQKLNIAGATSERNFRKMTNVFSRSSEQMFDYAKSALAVGATIGGIAFSAKSITDYETAVASFRTIVSDLGEADFSKFKDEIKTVALETKKSSVDVAKSFETIAGLNEKFAATSYGLGEVSTAAITLAKASRMDLGPASESLVGIMNQFSYGTEQATRTINALAAGQAVGAASITQTADALTNLGSTSAGANISLEQSIALIQTMAKYGQQGAEAGSRLRSSLVKIQETGLGYKSGRFQITDALDELRKKYDLLGSAQAKDAFLTSTFGLEQITTGRILLTNIPLINDFTKRVTGTSEATVAAAINSNTLTNRLQELSNKWVTIITTTESAGFGLNLFKDTIAFVTNNLDLLVSVGGAALVFFGTWKAYTLAATSAAWAFSKVVGAINFVQGIATVINGQYATSCFATVAGMNGMTVAAAALEVGLVELTIVGGGVVALLGLLAMGYAHSFDETKKYAQANEEMKNGFVQISEPISKATLALNEYNNAVKDFNEYQNFKAYKEYEHSKGFFRGLSADVYNIFAHPIYTNRAAQERGTGDKIEAPKVEDYPFINRDSTTNNTNTQIIEHKHTVDITQNGKVVGSFNTGASLQPSISSTSQYKSA